MEEAPGHVLKSSDVKVEGTFRLEVDQGVLVQANAGNAKLAQPEVLVMENHPEFAVMEVTCRCGDKTQIRCEYAATNSTEQEPEKAK